MFTALRGSAAKVCASGSCGEKLSGGGANLRAESALPDRVGGGVKLLDEREKLDDVVAVERREVGVRDGLPPPARGGPAAAVAAGHRRCVRHDASFRRCHRRARAR